MIDEIVSLTVAYGKVVKYVTPEMQWQAEEWLDKWMPIYKPYVVVSD